ncbi:MAG: hypothetical protein B5M54_10580 [Candidatus Aminicenantes bacterium 4484_214]|nr:MAG: hypothetical protein B5M54_10580 [Candidatus Aminicenantes bacterium 4484_214]
MAEAWFRLEASQLRNYSRYLLDSEWSKSVRLSKNLARRDSDKLFDGLSFYINSYPNLES